MGNSLRKKGFAYELDQYSKVPLTSLSDDSEEEDIIYGHNVENGKIELQLMPPQNGKPTKRPKPQRKVIQPDPKTGTVVCWVGCILVLCVVIAVLGIVRWSASGEGGTKLINTTEPVPVHHGGKQPFIIHTTPRSVSETVKHISHPPGRDWKKKMDNHGTESCVRLMDVDSDGILDIIVGVVENDMMAKAVGGTNKTIQDICKEANRKYPCVGQLLALKGTDGSVIWETRVKLEVIFINCEDFDVNLDGQNDCIVTGRMSTLQAVDSKTGNILWLGNDKFVKPTWNIYQALALPDFDKDGVPEVLLTNGGDPSKEPSDHNRKSGRLIVLSGRTGENIGSRFLPAPHKKEIYMSPVMYKTKDGSQYILFGSGGETVPGNLYVISVPDLYNYVTNAPMNTVIPQVPGKYGDWQHLMKDGVTGLITVLRGVKKGYMTPPVIVDVDKDGTEDIMVSAYDGKLILLDGKDLSKKWSIDFPNMESYTSPAPGYFNDDDTLDFMVHWSYGTWPMYTYTQNFIVDGRDGSILLTMNSTFYQMASDLTLHTNQPQRDLFIFKVKGRNSHITVGKDGKYSGLNRTKESDGGVVSESHGPLGNPHKKMKRHIVNGTDVEYSPSNSISDIYEDYSSQHFLCTDDIDIKNEVLLFDRTTMDSPVVLMETGIIKYDYSTQDLENPSKNKSMCIVVRPDDRTTAAVGDVDGDGVLDIVSLIPMVGQKIDSRYSYVETLYDTYIKKTSIGPAIKDPSRRTQAKVTTSVDKTPSDKAIADVSVLPKDKQSWTEYQGGKGNGYY